MRSAIAGLRIPGPAQRTLEAFAATLEARLGDNLHSLIVYGSAVRGGFDPARSDLNVLIVLAASTPDAHAVIGDALRGTRPEVDPFVLSAVGIERSFRAFAVKFDSLHRHHVLLAGADVLGDFELDVELARFLNEQALRNLRLRSVQAYMKWRREPKRYASWLQHTTPLVFTQLAEALRLRGDIVPDDFGARVPQLAAAYGLAPDQLDGLLAGADRMTERDVDARHRLVFGVLDAAVTALPELA